MDKNQAMSEKPPPEYQVSLAYPSLPSAPVIMQPGALNLSNLGGEGAPMIGQSAINNFLEKLNGASHLMIDQRLQLVEILTGWLQENKFQVWVDRDTAPFYGVEKSDCFARNCCANRRNFEFGLKNGKGELLLKVERPINCSMCCGALFPDSIVVKLGNERVLGYVKERLNFVPHFAILNSSGHEIFELKARLITYVCGPSDSIQFKVIESRTNKTVARIVKHWSGICQECCTEADKYSIEFDTTWDPETKALLLGVFSLINIRHFEDCCGMFSRLFCSMCCQVTGKFR